MIASWLSSNYMKANADKSHLLISSKSQRSLCIQGREANYLSANPTKWSNTPTQFVGNLPKNCLSVFDHFVGLALKGFIYLFTLFNVGLQNS